MSLTGLVLYEGPSRLNGEPIVAVATFRTANRKTGNVIQTWILPQTDRPEKAAVSGKDASVCGDCPLRPVETGLCYVNTGQAPLSVYSAWQRGSYVKADFRRAAHRDAFRGRMLRMGSYGEPVAIPRSVWDKPLRYSEGHVGYTHQWARFPEYSGILMASVHSPFEAECAAAGGWRTFRSRNEDQPVLPSEVVCPASPEGGHRRSCKECGGCNGNAGGSSTRRSFVIISHGRFNQAKQRHAFHLGR